MHYARLPASPCKPPTSATRQLPPPPSRCCPAHTPMEQACRSVKFSPAPLDLMAFAEHRSRCHIVDCRMWDRQQVGLFRPWYVRKE